MPILQGCHAACLPPSRFHHLDPVCSCPSSVLRSSLAGGCPHRPEVCQALLLGRVGRLCFLPASRTHCSSRQRKMDFWFQGVIRPGTSIRLCCPPLSFSPLLISALGCGGEIAIVKRPLVKIKITLLNNATAPWADSPGCARGSARVVAQGRGWSSKSQPCLLLAVLPDHPVPQFSRLSDGDNNSFYTAELKGRIQ